MRNSWLFFLLILTSVYLHAGCSATNQSTNQQTGTNAANSESRFVRSIAPFSVTGPGGQTYDQPFLGGFNVPRPQLLDIDADGDNDLFVQEVTGSIIFFENTGTPTEPVFRWQTDKFQNLDIGEWSRFYDMDDDGDIDLLAEQPFSYIRYIRNEGTPEEPAFRVIGDTLPDASGVPLFSDRQNIPNLADIDCDGNIDLFIGRVEGTVMQFETGTVGPDQIPAFSLITERFENIEIIGQVMGSLHGANTLAFYDYDNDGDQDLFWGDFFEPGLLLIENTGTCQSPAMRDTPIPFPMGNPVSTSGYNAPSFGDLNGDGHQDLVMGVLGGAFNPIVTAADNLYYFTQDENNAFTLQTRRLIQGIDIGSESIVTFADYDGDNDQDMFVANKLDPSTIERAYLYIYENTGTPDMPAFAFSDTLKLEDAYHYAPAFGDLDNDGDLDLLVGTWTQGIALYRNTGSKSEPIYEPESLSYIKLTRGSNTTPALVDIDADGDLDLFSGEASGTLNFYRNEGTPDEPDFVLVSDEYLEADVGRRSFPAFFDFDQDGDMDLVLGQEKGGLTFYRNNGSATEPLFEADPNFELPLRSLSTPAFVDIDMDGDMDLFSGSDGGGIVFYENQ